MAPMQLSEAIRLGAMGREQGEGWLMTRDGKTCAIGAALDAMGRFSGIEHQSPAYFHLYVEAERLWPILQSVVVSPNGGMGGALRCVIEELNDHHRWTREQIADFVEQIERAQEPEIGSGNQVAMEPALTTRRSEAP